jgi:hypothetical protein
MYLMSPRWILCIGGSNVNVGLAKLNGAARGGTLIRRCVLSKIGWDIPSDKKQKAPQIFFLGGHEIQKVCSLDVKMIRDQIVELASDVSHELFYA